MKTEMTNSNQLMGYAFATLSLVFMLWVFVELPYLSPDRRTIMNVVVGVLGATLTSFVAGKMLLKMSGTYKGARIAISASAGLAMFVFLLVKPVFAASDTRTPQERDVDALRDRIADLNSDFANWRASDAAKNYVQEHAQKFGDEMLAIDSGDDKNLDRIRQTLRYAMSGYAYLMAAEVASTKDAKGQLAYVALDNLNKALVASSTASDEDTKKWIADSEISDFVNFNLALAGRIYESATGIQSVEALVQNAFSRAGDGYKKRAATQNEPYLAGLR